MKTFYLSLWVTVALAVALFNVTVAFSTGNYLVLAGLGGYGVLLHSFRQAFAREGEFFISPGRRPHLRGNPIIPLDYIAEGRRFR